MVSIIIRTKNEERWITACLTSVFNQDYKDFEVFIVDNDSSDKTIEKALQFDIAKVIACKDYRPGLALNMGIRESKGEFIVCLSGHCIPVDNKWLSHLLRNIDDIEVAGVYGRQESLAFTSDSDKRDLSIIFGLDRKVQSKDSFFHNANSMIRRDLWNDVPFDETVTNIEDRVWAQKMLHKGYKIVYEPEASVYHYHGIHQDGDTKRCVNVVRILETINPEIKDSLHINIDKLNIVAIIPVKGEIDYIDKRPLIEYTLEQALSSQYVKKVIVSTDNRELAKLSEQMGAQAPFLRDESLSKDFIDMEKVMQYSLNQIEKLKIYPELVVYLEITFPFRPKGLIDAIIKQLISGGFDSIMAARKENKSIWKEESGKITRIDQGNMPRLYKEASYIGIRGLCCVTHPEFIREGTLMGERIGIYDVGDMVSTLEVREKTDFELTKILLDYWTRTR
jgi:CMP-N-acetylneuraminic acid synthetase|tara:strand:+ start:936 stop:2285 length:1350 start_codon:yes stop_codon:yes gene_type:complete